MCCRSTGALAPCKGTQAWQLWVCRAALESLGEPVGQISYLGVADVLGQPQAVSVKAAWRLVSA